MNKFKIDDSIFEEIQSMDGDELDIMRNYFQLSYGEHLILTEALAKISLDIDDYADEFDYEQEIINYKDSIITVRRFKKSGLLAKALLFYYNSLDHMINSIGLYDSTFDEFYYFETGTGDFKDFLVGGNGDETKLNEFLEILNK